MRPEGTIRAAIVNGASDYRPHYCVPMLSPDPLAGQITEMYVATLTPAGRPVFRNRSWARLLGESESPWDRLDPGDARAAEANVREAAGGSLVTGQLFLVPRGASTTPLLLNFLPVHDPDRVSAVSAVVVTGELLVQPESWTGSQTERHRMETLGRMTMGMAHDFNNLLSAILGHVELLRSAAEQHAPAAADEHVSTIERAALDGATLIERIQRYIRQEQRSQYEALDLAALLQDGISLTRPYWYNEPRRQGIEIGVETDFAETPAILGSAAELRDALVNLILNAVQAMPDGGAIRIGTFAQGAVAGFRIADTGTGMTDDVRERIFEPLFTTKGDRGNGMGLAVTYGIVQEHGGTIAVESAPGRGTTFELSFPIAVRDTKPPAGEVRDADERTFRILVVDDEPMVRSVLRRLLGLRGHEVVEAPSGHAALKAFGSDRFDVVITDQGMPNMSGRELAGELRARGVETPIVLLSGDTHAGEADDTVSAVLSKPFRIDDVESTIRRLA